MTSDFSRAVIHDNEIRIRNEDKNDDHGFTERTNIWGGEIFINSINLQGLIRW